MSTEFGLMKCEMYTVYNDSVSGNGSTENWCFLTKSRYEFKAEP